MTVSTQTIDQYMDLLKRFMGLRLDPMQPESLARFQPQLEKLYNGASSKDDRAFLFRIFTRLAHSDTPPTMSELSAYLNLPFSSTTRLVDMLVRVDFVERLTDAHDRRMVRVHMTDNGAQLYQLTMDYNKQQIGRLLKNFSVSEQAQLLRLMNKLLDVLSAEQ